MSHLKMEDNTMSIVRFSNPVPSMFDRFFESDLFDWSNRNFSMTNTTLPSFNIKENNDKLEVAAPGFKRVTLSWN